LHLLAWLLLTTLLLVVAGLVAVLTQTLVVRQPVVVLGVIAQAQVYP
jgi:hypothetical protein